VKILNLVSHPSAGVEKCMLFAFIDKSASTYAILTTRMRAFKTVELKLSKRDNSDPNTLMVRTSKFEVR